MPNESTPSAQPFDLLDVLVCPKCKGELGRRETPPAFVCERCRLVYAIEDDLPNLIIEEAKPL
jgi:uncharacterized protein YbaR (Trm112 family)